ncbi:MAG: murein biosynthesis integral membrane protein MurJ [Candidatus Babeliales bacterium]
MSTLHKKSILTKTLQVGGSTAISRLLGVAREVLLGNYLGASALLDAFITAFKIPNSLRKIFAEGALSASFVPTIVTMMKSGDKEHANAFMTRSFVVIEGILIAVCALIFWQAQGVIRGIMPGWFIGHESVSFCGFPIPAAWLGLGEALPQVATAVLFLRILIAFIVFISSSALLASVLQAVNHFFVPAFSPILLNLFFIAGVLIGWLGGYSPVVLCVFILLGGLVQFLMHLWVYCKLGFGFSTAYDAQAEVYFRQVLIKFFPCLLSMSLMEISLFIDTSFASYLPAGSITLIYLANRFMGIALGVFAVAFSTILLPHFSRISTYAPQRLSFYMLEAAKFVFWVTVPVVIMMSFFAGNIFHTLFSKFTEIQAHEAGHILIAFLLGLFFFSLNKILLGVYYALHNTRTPALIAFASTLVNIGFNALLMNYYQGTGLALATSLAGLMQTMLLLLFLRIHFDFKIYAYPFMDFARTYCLQLFVILLPMVGVYYGISWLISSLFSSSLTHFFLNSLGFWFWVGPLCGLSFLIIFYTRKWFKVQLYFLD